MSVPRRVEAESGSIQIDPKYLEQGRDHSDAAQGKDVSGRKGNASKVGGNPGEGAGNATETGGQAAAIETAHAIRNPIRPPRMALVRLIRIDIP